MARPSLLELSKVRKKGKWESFKVIAEFLLLHLLDSFSPRIFLSLSVLLVILSRSRADRQTDTPFKMRNRRSKSGFTFTFALTIRLRFISFRMSRQSRGKLKLETKVSTNKALGGGFLWCIHLFYQWHSLPKSRILTCCSSCILRPSQDCWMNIIYGLFTFLLHIFDGHESFFRRNIWLKNKYKLEL